MPQISKALLSDLMYITNAYLDGLIKESMGISEYRPKTKEWLQNEEAFTKNALNQLRALYEVSDSSFGGPVHRLSQEAKMSLNKHWPEPIEVNADPDTQGDFYVEEIIRAVYDEDGNKLRELRGDDEEGYSVLHRTAYRLENCYNACAGLNIQSDTNLKDVLEQAIHSLLTEEDVKYTAKLLQSLIAKNILED